MKKIIFGTIFSFLMLTFVVIPAFAKTEKCTAIQSGELLASDGSVIATGYDKWGYNYQAKLFNGKYCDAYRDAAWCQPYKEDNLAMKWNDAWLSNKDCDGDGLLDRHYGFSSYVGSGAWLTNHQNGEYEEDDRTCKWEYFTKIVAVPDGAQARDGIYYTASGDRIGFVIWGEFAVTQEISKDSCYPENSYSIHEFRPGLGVFKP